MPNKLAGRNKFCFSSEPKVASELLRSPLWREEPQQVQMRADWAELQVVRNIAKRMRPNPVSHGAQGRRRWSLTVLDCPWLSLTVLMVQGVRGPGALRCGVVAEVHLARPAAAGRRVIEEHRMRPGLERGRGV